MSQTDPVPKIVRGEPVETDDGEQVPVQQPTGPDTREGGGEFPSPSTPPADLVEYEPRRVPVNMYETEGSLVLVAPLPGVMADDIEVRVGAGQVHITAAQRAPAAKDYRLHEWHYGPYERMVGIPKGFGKSATATFGNGQLALRIERGDSGPETLVVRPSR